MRKLLILMAAVALVVAGCGEDDGAGTTGSGSGSGSGVESGGEAPVKLEGEVDDHGTAAAADEMKLELGDNYFGPTFIQAEPGETFTIELENEGTTTHTFTSEALDVDEEVAAGESADVEVTMPEQGATLFFCSIHEALGMQGAFFFEEGDKIGATVDQSKGTIDPGY